MITVENLTFRYRKNQPNILNDISFHVKEGEIFGLLGPSGAGKSTLQKILLGLLKQYEGNVKVMGAEANRISPDFYNKVGVGFELPNLYEQLTIEENLSTFARLYKERADIHQLLKDVGLLEHRYKKVSELSKGMKMRLNFCRALVGNPSILFLDEPTSGLDPNNTKVIQDKILEYRKKGYTVILTTHNMSFAEKICDEVAFIVEGTIKEIGNPQELRRRYGNCSIKVTTEKGETLYPFEQIGQNTDFLKEIKDDLISIDTIRPTLEEIFTIVTGRILV
ncbi:MAG TPA: ABC transporter ATP-binding protein [Lachnospiraceae bacterium]|nr:ABC transporter ATP-binding protein [Lachnospiraceae bacterium]